MPAPKLKFLTERAIVLDKTLIIGDLHLGMEYELAKKGITVPSQTQIIRERIENLISRAEESNLRFGAAFLKSCGELKEIVFLGDIRHNIPVPSKQEKQELPEFFKKLLEKANVSVIKGNHDGEIEDVLPEKVKLYSASGFRIGDTYLCHGTAWPKKEVLDCSVLIMGHIHPAIEFFSSGFRMTEHVWIRSPVNKEDLEKKYGKHSDLREVIIAPAFNHLIGGMPFNAKDFSPSGPILKKVCNLPEANVFLLDGTHLGKLKYLKIKHL